MNRRYNPRSAYLPEYSPSRQAVANDGNPNKSNTNFVTESKFPDYQEEVDFNNQNPNPLPPRIAHPTLDQYHHQNEQKPPHSILNQHHVVQHNYMEPDFMQNIAKPLSEQKQIKVELVRYNQIGHGLPMTPNYQIPHQAHYPTGLGKLELNAPNERPKSPILSHRSGNSRSQKELEPISKNRPSHEEHFNPLNIKMRPEVIGNPQSKPYAIFTSDNFDGNYEQKSTKRSFLEQQTLDSLPNDRVALKTDILSKEFEIKHLKEKIALLKEASNTRIIHSSKDDQEKIEKFKLDQLERDLKAAQKENDYLLKEIERYKSEAKRQTDKYNQKIYSMKVNFDVDQRVMMEEVERNIVFGRANREDGEVDLLMSRVLELEAMSK
jgi:hypothetical protein